MAKNLKIEVESGEIAIRNSYGDIAIIPKDKAAYVRERLSAGCFECIDKVVEELPLMENYAEDGTLIVTDPPVTDPPVKKVAIETTTPDQYIAITSDSTEYQDIVNSDEYYKYDIERNTYETNLPEITVKPERKNNFSFEQVQKFKDYIIDIDDNKINKEYSDKYLKIHENSNKACLAGALNCNTDDVALPLGLQPIRSMIQESVPNIKNSSYNVNSSSDDPEYVPNQSIDSWEIGDLMINENLGRVLYRNDNYSEENVSFDSSIDLSKIPLGAIILSGNSKGKFTNEQDGNKDSHSVTVSGFDKNGVPLVYNYGALRRITDSQNVNKIIIPSGYDEYTFSNISNYENLSKQILGFDKPQIPLGTTNKSISLIDDVLRNKIEELGLQYNVNSSIAEKIRKRLIGIGIQESKLNNTLSDDDYKAIALTKGLTEEQFEEEKPSLGRKAKIELFDGNLLGGITKSIAKTGINISESIPLAIDNLISDENEELYPWEHEIEIYNKLKNQYSGDELYKKIKEELSEVPMNKYKDGLDWNLKSSIGPFAIKELPEEYKDKGRKFLRKGGKDQELKAGAEVALTIMYKNYDRFKRKYPDLNENQLIDLTTIAYNNGSKPMSDEYIDYYIRKSVLKDNYLEKVKTFEKALIK